MKVGIVRFVGACALVLGASLAAAPPALAQDATAQARMLDVEGSGLFQSKQYRAALERFRAAYTALPNPNSAWNIARCYEELRELHKAIRAFEVYAEEAGVTAADKKDAQEHITQLRARLESWTARFEEATQLDQTDRHSEAAAAWAAAFALHAEPETQLRLGLSQVRAGALDEARVTLGGLLEVTDLPPTLRAQARQGLDVLARQEGEREGEARATRLVEQARGLEAEGRHAEAQGLWQQALDARFTPDALHGLARSLDRNGQRALARDRWRQLAGLDSASEAQRAEARERVAALGGEGEVGSSTRWIAWTLLGASAVSAGVGGYFALLYNQDYADLEVAASTPGATDRYNQLNTALDQDIVGMGVSFGVAGAALVGGLLLLLVDEGEGAAPGAGLWLGVGDGAGIGVRVGGGW